jgi:pyruvate dehydrogenase E1 component alpha subunit
MLRALAHAREGGGPSTIEATTTRFYGHFEGDPQKYRAKDEVARQRATMDCLKRFRDQGVVSSDELDVIDAEVLRLIEECVVAAKAAPMPTLADLTTDVYMSY